MAAPAAAGSRAAIVSTMRFPKFGARVVDSFIAYHAAVGFCHLYLFFDDPEDAAVARARAHPAALVTVTVHDAALAARWEACPSHARLSPFIDDEVQARQHLNCEVAMDMAVRGAPAPVDWLLHIDSDELFYTAAPNVCDHFAGLYHDGVWQMTYMNHEGVPETSAGVDDDVNDDHDVDYFKATSLFRRHHFDVPMSARARAGMRYWETRSRHGQYLLCYDNGKSAVRVVAGAKPRNVHQWVLPDPAAMPSRTALVDPRTLELSRVRKCRDPCILHFVVCGRRWLQSKYEMLGAFEDAWFGGELPIAPSFHLDARDAWARGGMEELWNTQVAFGDADVLREQLEAGVLLRIERPGRILRGGAAGDGGANVEPAAPSAPAMAPAETLSAAPASAAAAPASAAAAPASAAAAPASADAYSYSKAWAISQAVQNFL